MEVFAVAVLKELEKAKEVPMVYVQQLEAQAQAQAPPQQQKEIPPQGNAIRVACRSPYTHHKTYPARPYLACSSHIQELSHVSLKKDIYSCV